MNLPGSADFSPQEATPAQERSCGPNPAILTGSRSRREAALPGGLPSNRHESLLKRTTSRCPICHASCPAEVVRIGNHPGRVDLRRTCAKHGDFSVCIASDARFYWLSKGDARNACRPGSACCSADGSAQGTLGRNASGRGDRPFETLSTCLALIEIVNSCNLACPTCYADSPQGAGHHTDAVPLADLQRRIQGVIDRKGKIEILQLSGGEPTLHPRFFDLVRWAQANPGIDYLLLNTNGVRLAKDDAFLDELSRTFRYGGMQLYLQFDGPQEAGQRELRGADLRALRLAAIERCGQISLPLTLAMTVTPANLPHLWETIAFGLKYPQVRGVSFQPMFRSGRLPSTVGRDQVGRDCVEPLGVPHPVGRDSGEPPHPGTRQGFIHVRPTKPHVTVADIILASVEQSQGVLRFSDFTPLPCGDPNCATIGYLLKVNGQVRSISDFVDFSQVQGFLHDRVRYQLRDLSRCGCENEPLGALLKQFELDETHTFRLFIKPFMDAETWDEDRIDRCCTHVIRPDGKLDSFCRYYATRA